MYWPQPLLVNCVVFGRNLVKPLETFKFYFVLGNLPPGQYLAISNPHLGSYVQDLSAYNPTNLFNKWQMGVKLALEEFGNHF